MTGVLAAGIWHRRRVPAVLLMGSLAFAVAVAAAGCSRTAPPALDIDLAGAAPEVVVAVRSAHDRVQADPQSAPAWLTLGQVCEANGLFVDAQRAYEQSIALDEGNPRAWYRLALARTRAGEIEDGLRALERATALDDRYAPAHWRRGLWLLDLGRAEEAQAAFQRATELDPASPGGWVGLARVALHQQQASRAIEVLEHFLSRHPGDRYALRLLGTAYQRSGRTGEAEYALAVGASGEPSWPDPWTEQLAEHRVGFAKTLKAATEGMMAGQFDRAIPLLEKLQRERPDDLSLLHQLGLSYVAVGRAADGVALLEQALARDPDNLETHLRLASAYINTNDPERALRHAERAVQLSPELGRAHEARGMALWRGNRPREALASFQQTIRFDPANANAHVWVGSILLDEGRDADAQAGFERALASNPTLADAYIGLGLVYLRRRQLSTADEALTRAATLEPANPRLRAALAELERARQGRRP